MRRQCPESGCVRGHVQALVMCCILPVKHGSCVVNSHRHRRLKLDSEPEFVLLEREWEWEALPIHAREVALLLHEPSNDALGV